MRCFERFEFCEVIVSIDSKLQKGLFLPSLLRARDAHAQNPRSPRTPSRRGSQLETRMRRTLDRPAHRADEDHSSRRACAEPSIAPHTEQTRITARDAQNPQLETRMRRTPDRPAHRADEDHSSRRAEPTARDAHAQNPRSPRTPSRRGSQLETRMRRTLDRPAHRADEDHSSRRACAEPSIAPHTEQTRITARDAHAKNPRSPRTPSRRGSQLETRMRRTPDRPAHRADEDHSSRRACAEPSIAPHTEQTRITARDAQNPQLETRMRRTLDRPAHRADEDLSSRRACAEPSIAPHTEQTRISARDAHAQNPLSPRTPSRRGSQLATRMRRTLDRPAHRADEDHSSRRACAEPSIAPHTEQTRISARDAHAQNPRSPRTPSRRGSQLETHMRRTLDRPAHRADEGSQLETRIALNPRSPRTPSRRGSQLETCMRRTRADEDHSSRTRTPSRRGSQLATRRTHSSRRACAEPSIAPHTEQTRISARDAHAQNPRSPRTPSRRGSQLATRMLRTPDRPAHRADEDLSSRRACAEPSIAPHTEQTRITARDAHAQNPRSPRTPSRRGSQLETRMR